MSTWIFLRGLTRERRHWGDFPEVFRGEIPVARVITLDLPGNGSLAAAASPPRIEDMAQFCRAELQRMGVPPPYRLLAMSLGAMVAAAWMFDHPDEIAAGVLINTSMRPFSPLHWRLRPRCYPALLRLALPWTTADERERTIFRLTSRRPEREAATVKGWIAWRRSASVSAGNAFRQIGAAARFRVPDGRPVPPVLILASAGDALVDPRCSRQLAAQWQVRLSEHPDAGHDLPLDDGRWVARQVAAWLADLGPISDGSEN